MKFKRAVVSKVLCQLRNERISLYYNPRKETKQTTEDDKKNVLCGENCRLVHQGRHDAQGKNYE